jgi:hypothetical protein
VGAAVPGFSLSGPGELDLFGQVVPTKPQFTGPIRPLLKLTHITIDDEVARVLRSDSPRTLELNLSQQLAQGWTHYFEWETLIAAGSPWSRWSRWPESPGSRTRRWRRPSSRASSW